MHKTNNNVFADLETKADKKRFWSMGSEPGANWTFGKDRKGTLSGTEIRLNIILL